MVEAPKSFNDFRDAHPDIPETELTRRFTLDVLAPAFVAANPTMLPEVLYIQDRIEKNETRSDAAA